MDILNIFRENFTESPVLLARSPGRVNLLGEHVDYNEGPVLPAAIDRSVHLCANPTRDDVVTLIAQDLNEKVAFSLTDLYQKRDLVGKPLPNWALYPAGVAWALQQSGYPLCGMRAVFSSDVPIGAGLSSSAAIEVTFAVAWQGLFGWEASRMTLARLCQQAENEYVGVKCGLMDQFAIAHGVKGHALYFDTRTLDWEPVPLPAGTAMVIADSGVRRSLVTSAYNERRAACQQAVLQLRQYLPKMNTLRDISPPEFAAYSEFLPPAIRNYAEHVVKEIARVQTALRALRANDARTFGALMFSGHASLRDLYQVSCPELDTLVNIARHLPGCFGARLTGAGFGGCTVNLVDDSQAENFIRCLSEEYQSLTGRMAQVYLCRASQGASTQKLY